MDRWMIYSYLKKTNGKVSIADMVLDFPDLDPDELAEGVAEFYIVASREPQFYLPEEYANEARLNKYRFEQINTE